MTKDAEKIWWSLSFLQALELIGEVFAALNTSIVLFRDVTSCGLVDRNEHFGGTFY